MFAIKFLTLQFGISVAIGGRSGSFGFADQINALDWVRNDTEDFGDDPERITIFGQSPGAASVRAMLASPNSIGKFAGAILQSNLGRVGHGTTYSRGLALRML